MRIIELHAENVMGLSACDITPADHLNVIGGKNGAGKSSLLNAICAALAGKGGMPSEPLKRGEKKGEIVVKLDRDGGAITVRRKLSADGKTSLVIEGERGTRFTKPQAMLDELVGAVGFDPAAFCRLDPKKQAEQLRELVGLDLSDLDGQRLRVFEERTEINRDVKRLQGVADSNPVNPDLPDSETSVSELLKKLEEAQAHNRGVSDAREKVADVAELIRKNAGDAEECLQTIEQLKRELADAESELEEIGRIGDALTKDRDNLQAAADAMEEIDCDPIHQQINGAEAANAAVRANRQAREIAAELQARKADSEQLTDQLAEIDEQRRERLAAADWPIDGLGFDDGVVTFNGLPFSQASSAEQLRVSLAMGMAANPSLRVLMIRDGSLMDDDTMQVVRELAEQHDFQVWIERVSSTGEGCSIVVTEGVAETIGGAA